MPVNWGLLQRSAREMLPVTLVCGALLMAFHSLLAYLLPSYQEQFANQVLAVPFIRNVLRGILGSDLSDRLGPEMFLALPWVHPVVLGIFWSHIVYCCTRVPVGELDLGTADLTFTLPVSRWRFYVTESLASLLASLFVTSMAAVGHLIGGTGVDTALRINSGALAITLFNLICLNASVAGLTCLASSAVNGRGRAASIAGSFAVVSFIINYLTQFWSFAERVSWASVLSYYRPVEIIQSSSWPWSDFAVLASLAALSWGAGGVILSQRDLCTV